MRVRRLATRAACLLLTAAGVVAGDDVLTATVTYVTGASVYVSAGRDDGLETGMRLVLRRGDEVVATLEVTDLSTHRAACKVVEQLLEPAVGDELRFVRVAAATEPVVDPPGARPDSASPRRVGRRAIRGRVGLRYLAVVDRTGQTGDYAQPAADLRIDGGGSAWGLAVDARARRTIRDPADGPSEEETRTRVYRLSVSRRAPDEPWGFTVGRQYSPALSAVSIFDGVAADYGRERWSVGLFSGTQPDPRDHGASSDVREHGTYVQLRGAPGTAARWSVTTGLIGSYQESEINREYLYVQGRFVRPRLWGFFTQEVDYNRDWKADAGEDTLSATGTFASLHADVGQRVTLNGGYDSRRNVRLYRDLVTPETEFDDSFRQGIWGGASFEIRERYRVGFDVRTNRRETEGVANSYTATLGARRLAGGRLDLRSRFTRYTNDRVEGWLHVLDLGTPLGRRSHLRLSGGLRDEQALVGIPSTRTLHWYGLDGDFSLGRHWYATVSIERTGGDLDEVDQLYTTLTWRF